MVQFHQPQPTHHHQPQQQQQQHGFLKYQNSQQEQQRSRSTRAAAVAATAAVSGTSASSKNMILDPVTGEMVPAGSDGEDNYDDDEDCYDEEDDDDVQVAQATKPVMINLGQLRNSSNSSSKNSLQVCVWFFAPLFYF
jgi:hypothetical protein